MIKSPSVFAPIALSLVTMLSAQAWAHAEHDKPRYVATTGEDKGRCDTPAKACKTIAYAAQNSNKGDIILVASGNYEIADVNTLFYLIGNVVPVKGGYSPKQFKRNISENPTRLVGVPLEYAEELTEKGFTVITDRKGMEKRDSAQLSDKLAVLEHMKSAQADVSCLSGVAGAFPCSNMDLVSHMPLASLGGSQGNDVWGHYDLNDLREYALMGLSNGVAIVDVSTPETPRLVSHIPGQQTTWRDIKVLQYFDGQAQRWKAYAYVTADNANVGTQILDLTQLPDQVTLIKADKSDLSAHNVYLSNVDYSTNVALTGMTPYLHIAGSNNNGGAFNTFSLAAPTSPTPLYRHPSNSRNNYSHDVASMAITDARKDSQCVNASSHCEILFDFNENDVRLWDKTNNNTPVELSRTGYDKASYVHSGWWSEDQLVMMVHDELDEQFHDLNTTLRFFDISDLTRPTLLSTYTGPTTAIDHNGFVRGNRYYMSNYERGLTVLDISNPAQPKEAGFFDTYPVSNLPAFNGAWGTYPFLPSGLILISDINSGLYVVRDRTLTVAQGTLSFSAQEFIADEGSAMTIQVTRTGGTTGAISVGYETQTGSANSSDFAAASGRLAWANGESGSKTFTVTISEDDAEELNELFFVRLFDPRGGATLSSPNLAHAVISGLANKGSISFVSSNLNVVETGTLSIPVQRRGGKDGSASVEVSTTASGFTFSPATLTWADGESGIKNVRLIPVDDNLTNGNRDISLSLTGEDVSTTSVTQLTVTIRDDESNTPPVFDNPDNSITANPGIQLTIAANATDSEGYPLTYLWEQTAGATVNLSGSTSDTVIFVTPDAPQTLTLRVTVSDDFGVSVSRDINVAITQSTAAPGSSKSGGGAIFWLLGLLLVLQRVPRQRP